MSDELNLDSAKSVLESGFEEAKKVIADDGKLEELLQSAEGKLKGIPVLGEGLSHIPLFVSMVRSWACKEYTEAPFMDIVAAVSAIMYWLKEDDLVNDKTPLLGRVDDAAVCMACYLLSKGDLDKYEQWRSTKKLEA